MAKADADFKDARNRLLALRGSGATNHEIPIFLGPIDAALGLNEDALTSARQMLATLGKDPNFVDLARQRLARVEMMTGHTDGALDQLEASFQSPGGISAGELLHDCNWDPLRGNTRFRRLLKKAVGASGQ